MTAIDIPMRDVMPDNAITCELRLKVPKTLAFRMRAFVWAMGAVRWVLGLQFIELDIKGEKQ